MTTFPPFGIWPPIVLDAAPPVTTATILRVNTDRWLDPNSGNDNNNGTFAFPWKTFQPFVDLLNEYTVIDGCYARLNIIAATPGNEPNFVTFDSPELRNQGKVVLLGVGASPATNSSFVASGASNTTTIATALYSSAADPVGWIAECTAGANLGVRVQIASATYVMGGAATLKPAATLPFAGVGDTWHLIRPSARLNFPAGTSLNGPGQTAIYDSEGDDPGIYIANLCLLTQPQIQLATVAIVSCEFFADNTFPGSGVTFSSCIASLGILFGPADWIDANAALWNGAGLTQRRETTSNANVGRLISQLSLSEVDGYACGTSWSSLSGRANFYGGALYGRFSGAEGSLHLREQAVATVGRVTSDLAVYITATGARNAIDVSDPDSVCELGFSVLAAATGALLRAQARGTINVITALGAPSGSSTGYAQDATGEGFIVWDAQPALIGTAGALAVNGTAAPNTLLLTAETALRVGIGSISRRVSGTPDTTLQQSLPFPPFNAGGPLAVIPDGNPVTIVPAAPAGYVNVLSNVSVTNPGATSSYVVESAGSPQSNVSSVSVGTTSIAIVSSAGPVVTDQAVTIRRTSGTSATAVVRGVYVQVPKQNFLFVNLALTAAFQSIAAVIPPANRASRIWMPSQSIIGGVVLNNDNVTHSVTGQVTRSAVVYPVNGSTTVTAGSKSSTFLPPVLLPGDVLEVKTAEAITTPGTVMLLLQMELVPLLT